MRNFQLQVVGPGDPTQFRLASLELPPPGRREVQVRIVAASVNPIDVKRAHGHGRRLLGLKRAATFPLTLGNDLVGRVVACGGGVDGLAEGDRVIGVKPMGPGGTHATGATLPVDCVRRLPSAASGIEHGALPYTFITMRRALADAGLHADSARGRRVLVHGASGGLGQLALRTLAKWGAEVTAICSTRSVRACRDLGAHAVIDRQQPGWRELRESFDATLNFAAWEDEAWLVSNLRRGALGHATTVHPLLGNFDRLGWVGGAWQNWHELQRGREAARRAGGASCRYAWTVFRSDGGLLDELVAELGPSGPYLPVAQTTSLDEAARAFEHVASGRPGRALLVCDEADRMQSSRDPGPEAPSGTRRHA